MSIQVKGFVEKLALALLGAKSVADLAEQRLDKREAFNLAQNKLDEATVAVLARQKLKRALALETAYKTLQLDDAMVLLARLSGFTTFEDFARRTVLNAESIQNTTREYVLRLIIRGNDSVMVHYNVAITLFNELAELTEQVEANEKSFMKKHSAVLQKVKKHLPLLSKSDSRLVVELLVSYVKRNQLTGV